MDTREALKLRLDMLEAALPAVVARCPDANDFWPAWLEIADGIEDEQHSFEDQQYVNARVDLMLRQCRIVMETPMPRPVRKIA